MAQKHVVIRETHGVEVPRTRNGRPGYAWVRGWTYTTPSGGQSVADTYANTLHACKQDWPDARLFVLGHGDMTP